MGVGWTELTIKVLGLIPFPYQRKISTEGIFFWGGGGGGGGGEHAM